ncbi:MAG: hypothetical protein AB8F95_03195 [Bacteroidia bacterium]
MKTRLNIALLLSLLTLLFACGNSTPQKAFQEDLSIDEAELYPYITDDSCSRFYIPMYVSYGDSSLGPCYKILMEIDVGYGPDSQLILPDARLINEQMRDCGRTDIKSELRFDNSSGTFVVSFKTRSFGEEGLRNASATYYVVYRILQNNFHANEVCITRGDLINFWIIRSDEYPGWPNNKWYFHTLFKEEGSHFDCPIHYKPGYWEK